MTTDYSQNRAPSFASGDGIVITPVGGSYYYSQAYSVALDAQGRILLGGYGTRYTNGGSAADDFAVVRYLSDGTLDPGFGTDAWFPDGGVVTVAVSPRNDYAISVLLQADGKILLPGYAAKQTNDYYGNAENAFAVVRLDADGALDTGYAGRGIVRTPIGNNAYADAATLQADGRLLVAGWSTTEGHETSDTAHYHFTLARYDDNGTLDSTFAGNGIATVTIGSGSRAHAVAVQPDGRIVLAGTAAIDNTRYFGNTDFALARYKPDGSLDDSFGSGGVSTSDFNNGFDTAQSVAIQPDGKILVAGYSNLPATNYAGDDYDFILARYDTNGNLDPSFGGGKGWLQTNASNYGNADYPYGYDFGYDVVLQPDGRILVAGESYNGGAMGGGSKDFALLRYNADGSLDTSFGNGDGVVNTPVTGRDDNGRSVIVQEDGKILVAGYDAGYRFVLVRYHPDGSLDRTFHPLPGTIGNSTASQTENGAAVILSPSARVADADLDASGTYSGATLRLAREGGANPEDRFSGPGILDGQASGNVVVGDTVIGSHTHAGGALTVTFGAAATQALVTQLMQSLAYRNTSDDPPASVRIQWTFSDGPPGDGDALSVTGFTLVNITAINDRPMASGSSITTAEDASVGGALSGTDADGDALTFRQATAPAHGTVLIDAATGSYTYMPARDYSGVDSFTYTVGDGTADSTPATVSITVTAVDDPPTGTVLIAGTATQGQALTATAALADPDGLGPITLQWKANGVPVPGASGTTLVLTSQQTGKTITVAASYVDQGGKAESVTSLPTRPVGAIKAGTDTAESLAGSAGDDRIDAAAGNDTIGAGAGNDRIDGGSGQDIALYSGPIAGYALARNGATLTVTDRTEDRDGTDTLTNVERLQFSDMSVNLTVQATAASIDPAKLDRICELYVGFFSRVPAADGLENWINQFKGGKSINTIANDFQGIGSSEALRAITGYWDLTNNRALGDQDFVKIVYRNVLGREGLQRGIDYWAGQLTGTDAKTRGELVSTMLDAAHVLKPDADWGWVANLLDDRITMSRRVAIEWGLNYGATAADAIAKGVSIANSFTEEANPAFPTSPIKHFDFAAATDLIGIDPANIDLIA